MSQSNLPAPLAPRPDPGAQLLEAVRQRQARSSLLLAQQWVHRRGVRDLEHFCGTQLSSALGPDAMTWLQELLALGNASLTGDETMTTTAAVADAAEPAGRPAPPASPLASASPALLEERRASDPELEARAVAAVDAAFAALAASFQELDQLTAPLSQPEAAASATVAASAPQPMPVRSGLWPSLRASAAGVSGAIRPLSGPGPIRVVSERPSAPSVTQLDEQDAADARSRQEVAASPAPQPQDEDAPLSPVESGPLATPLARSDAAGAQTAENTDAVVSSPAALSAATSPAETAETGLLGRLRGQIRRGQLPQLTRLRAVIRDCVEETVAMLRAPASDRRDDASGDAVSGDDVSGFDRPAPGDTPRPSGEQLSTAWSVEPFLPPSPAPDPAAVTTVRAPAAEQPAPMAEPSAPPAPSPAPRLRFRLPISQPAVDDERPAPAPAALSDLRAWLPDRGDLPRAS